MRGPHWRDKRTVFVFGAGASKECGGPLTHEILPRAFDPDQKPDYKVPELVEKVSDCLVQHFHVPANVLERTVDDYPPLPLLLSLLDLAIDQDRPLVFPDSTCCAEGQRQRQERLWSHDRLSMARRAIEYVIYAVLDAPLANVAHNWYERLFRSLGFADRGSARGPSVISLNYDILIDKVLFKIAADHGGDDARPSYACDIQTEPYLRRKTTYGELLKLHGSLNWLYCPSCRRLEIGMSPSGSLGDRCPALDELHRQHPLEQHYDSGSPCSCPDCETPFRAVMVAPSRAKDYRNPHIQAIWYRAERVLRKADHVYFVGYSLPDDDVEVIDLLRRGSAICLRNRSRLSDRLATITLTGLHVLISCFVDTSRSSEGESIGTAMDLLHG